MKSNEKQDKYVIETQRYEFVRDLSGLGNPIILILLFTSTYNNLNKILIFIFGLLVLELFVNVLKYVFFVDRPIKHKYTNIKEKLLASSFPSLHISRLTYFLCWYDISIGTFASLLLLGLLFYSRIKLGKHRIIDLVIGIIIALFIYLLVQVALQNF